MQEDVISFDSLHCPFCRQAGGVFHNAKTTQSQKCASEKLEKKLFNFKSFIFFFFLVFLISNNLEKFNTL